MPRGDRTGPVGAGPATGRGLGFCTGFKTPGYLNSSSGGIFGVGRGRRRGRMLLVGSVLPACVYLAHRWGQRRKN